MDTSMWRVVCLLSAIRDAKSYLILANILLKFETLISNGLYCYNAREKEEGDEIEEMSCYIFVFEVGNYCGL